MQLNILGDERIPNGRTVSTYTILIQIVAAATINFSPAWVRLLIEGSSYSRAALLIFWADTRQCNPQKMQHRRLIFEDCTSSNRDTIVKEALTLQENQAKTVFCHAPNKRAHSTGDRDHTHLIEFAHACGYHFFRFSRWRQWPAKRARTYKKEKRGNQN